MELRLLLLRLLQRLPTETQQVPEHVQLRAGIGQPLNISRHRCGRIAAEDRFLSISSFISPVADIS